MIEPFKINKKPCLLEADIFYPLNQIYNILAKIYTKKYIIYIHTYIIF